MTTTLEDKERAGRPERPQPKDARFLLSAPSMKFYPEPAGTEIAVVGRSNVGKSSLLGALIDKPGIVRRSRTPGRTQHANFFADKEGHIWVDLPGYGFAEVPKKVKPELDKLIVEYISKRKNEVILLLLVDARREKAHDLDQMHLALAQSAKRRVIAVVTKIDRVGKAQRKPTRQAVAKSLGLDPADVFAVSTKSGDGIVELKRALHLLRTNPS